MAFEFKKVKTDKVIDDEGDDEIEEPIEVEEDETPEVEDESVSIDIPVSDDDYKLLISKLAEMMKEKGEGSVRDYLYNEGYEIDDVDKMLVDIHKAAKSGAKVDGKGMYASGGVKSISDDDTEFVEDFDVDESEQDAEDKPKKKSLKKSEFDDPVEEVFQMLKEGDPIPVKLAEKLLGSNENFERLLTREGVKKSKYQVYIESTDEIEEAAK